MDPEQPSDTEQFQSSQKSDQNNTGQLLELGVSYLLSPNKELHQKGKDILLLYQNGRQSEVLKKVILSINSGQTDQNKCLYFLFLRDKLHSYTEHEEIPNLTLQLEALITKVPKALRKIAAQCMNIYLNKPQVQVFKDEYIGNLIKKVEQQVNQNTLSESLIQTIILILSRPFYTKKTFQIIPKIIQNAIKNYQSQKPKQGVRFILALCRYADLTPPTYFLCQNIVDNLLGIEDILRLTQIFNKMTEFEDIQQAYGILRVQLHRLQKNWFMKLLNSLEDETSLEVIIMSIQKAISYIFKAQAKNKNPSTEETEIYNKALNKNFYIKMIERLLQLPELTDKSPIYSIINSITINLRRCNETHEIICEFINQICQKIQQIGKKQQIYQLMVSISPKIMRYFPYCKLIQSGFNQIKNNGSQISAQYLMMVAYCLRYVQETIEWKKTMGIIENLIKYCLQLEYKAQLDIRTLLFIVLCQYLPKSLKKDQLSGVVQSNQQFQDDFKFLLKIGFPLLRQLVYAQDVDQVSAETVFEGLWYSSVYSKGYQELIANYLQQFPQTDKNPIAVNLHLKFLAFFSLNMHKNQIENNTVLSLVQALFQSNPDVICQQCCQLILLVLNKLNSIWFGQDEQYSAYINQNFNKILSTKLIDYIQSNLKCKNDGVLFSKILMELIIHKEASSLIKQMLMRVVNTIYATQNIQEDTQYNFDRVWEAMVILYGEKNDYVEKKGIIKRVENFRFRQISSMIDAMGIGDQNIKEFVNFNQNRWSRLYDVRKVLSIGSIVGNFIDQKLRQHSY